MRWAISSGRYDSVVPESSTAGAGWSSVAVLTSRTEPLEKVTATLVKLTSKDEKLAPPAGLCSGSTCSGPMNLSVSMPPNRMAPESARRSLRYSEKALQSIRPWLTISSMTLGYLVSARSLAL